MGKSEGNHEHAGQSSVNKQRKLSTKFEDHLGLLHKFARGGFARLCSLGVDLDYEDAFQECCVSFVKAQKTYNPDAGVGFSAYMGRAVINNFNRYAEKVIREHLGLGIVHIEDIVSELDDGFRDPYDFVGGVTDDHVDRIANLSEVRENIKKLSPKAKMVVRDLLRTPKVIEDQHKAQLAHAQFAKSIGEPHPYVPKDVTLLYLAKYHGIKYKELREELSQKLKIEGI